MRKQSGGTLHGREELTAIRQKYASTYSMMDIAYWTIRDAIRSGVIGVGEALIELELSEELEMSRTPIREALRKLAADQLIEPGPRRGYVVPEISMSDLVENFEIRELLEGLAARYAAQRMSSSETEVLGLIVEQHLAAVEEDDYPMIQTTADRFHRMIRNTSKHSRIPQMIMVLKDSIRSSESRELAPDRTKEAAREHKAIYEAIAANDHNRAEELMRAHVRNALRAQFLKISSGS